MSINSKTKSTVDTLLTSDTTTEAQFKTGLQDVTAEVDSLNTGTVKTSTSFGGDVSGTYNAIVVANDSHTHDNRYYTETEIDNMFSGTTDKTGYNNDNWDDAYGWGDHGSANYLTSVSFSNIDGGAIQTSSEIYDSNGSAGNTDNFANNDTSLLTAAAIDDRIISRLPTDSPPSDTEREEWNAAYGWGDHADAGYLTAVGDISFTDLTDKPTTISGYGITDAFDGEFSSLSSTPTTLSGYGITDALSTGGGTVSGTLTVSGKAVIDKVDIDSATIKSTNSTDLTLLSAGAQIRLSDQILQGTDVPVYTMTDTTVMADRSNNRLFAEMNYISGTDNSATNAIYAQQQVKTLNYDDVNFAGSWQLNIARGANIYQYIYAGGNQISLGAGDPNGANLFVNGDIDYDTAKGATQTINSASGGLTPDFDTYTNFIFNLSGSITLNNFNSEELGQTGMMVFIQDSNGSRTVSLGSDYETVNSQGITISTDPNAITLVPFFVRTGGVSAKVVLGNPIAKVG